MVCKICGREAKDWCPGCKCLSRIRYLWENQLVGKGEAESLTALRICGSELQDIVDGLHLSPVPREPAPRPGSVAAASGSGSADKTPASPEKAPAEESKSVKVEVPPSPEKPVTGAAPVAPAEDEEDESEEEEEGGEEDKEVDSKGPPAAQLGLTSIGAVLSAPTPEPTNHGKEKAERRAPDTGSDRGRDLHPGDDHHRGRAGAPASGSRRPQSPEGPPRRKEPKRDRSRSKKKKSKGEKKRRRAREWRASQYPDQRDQWRRKQR